MPAEVARWDERIDQSGVDRPGSKFLRVTASYTAVTLVSPAAAQHFSMLNAEQSRDRLRARKTNP